jgi:pSer/pThr/pTyr-binding forkhead associated (FHA) protein
MKADTSMKVTLVVASGVHQGKAIPILGPQFLIGRDPQCHLRPASQAVSKQHCAVIIRDGKVYVQDFGSTNGTLVNDVPVQNEERPVANNDSLKIGPLDFTVRIEPSVPKVDGTPLPDLNAEAAAALAAVKAVATPPAPAGKNATPAPRPGVAGPKAGNLETPKPGSDTQPPAGRGDEEGDRLAAMLLGLDDGDGPVEVPGGSTIAEMPAVDLGQPGAAQGGSAPDEKKDAKKQTPTREDTSNAASEILRKYMRRPK